MNNVNNIGTLAGRLQCIILACDEKIKNGGTPRAYVLNYIMKIAKNEDNSQEFLFKVLTFVYREIKNNIKMTTATQLDLIGDLNEIALKECKRNFVRLNKK